MVRSVSIIGFHYIHRLSRVFLPVSDAFGLALFTVLGAQKALMLGHSGVVAVLMGLLTGVAGGMLRDVLAQRVPMVLRQEIYATASIIGACTYVVMTSLSIHSYLAIALAIFVTLTLRLGAIYWRLSLPVFAWVTSSAEPPSCRDPDDVPPAIHKSSDKPRKKARVHLIRPGRTRQRAEKINKK